MSLKDATPSLSAGKKHFIAATLILDQDGGVRPARSAVLTHLHIVPVIKVETTDPETFLLQPGTEQVFLVCAHRNINAQVSGWSGDQVMTNQVTRSLYVKRTSPREVLPV